MNKFLMKTLIGLIVVFCLLPVNFVLANGLLNINFEQEPLFQETNFLPGESVTRWIEVENKSSETQPIAVKAINYSSCTVNCFSEQLELNISNGSTDIYTESLDQFFNAGEIKLSDLAAGNTIRYQFTVTFLPESGNQYQEKTVDFDFKIGSLGKESIGGEIGSGGSGGFFITGLNIYEEAISNIGETQANITWKTNKPATSRVIYSSEDQNHILELDNLPNYGYYYSTAEDSGLKENHEMVISGLSPGTTYYFRCVSRGSLAVSKELKFITAGVKGEEIAFQPFIPGFEIDPEVLGEEIKEDETIDEQEEKEKESEIKKTIASVAGAFNAQNFCWLFLLIIIILVALFLLLNKKIEKPKKWILPAIILIVVILYYIFCCSVCWVLVLLAFILFIFSLFITLKRGKTEVGHRT